MEVPEFLALPRQRRIVVRLVLGLSALTLFIWYGVWYYPGNVAGRSRDDSVPTGEGVYLRGTLVSVQPDSNQVLIRWALLGCGTGYSFSGVSGCDYLSRSVNVSFDEEVVMSYDASRLLSKSPARSKGSSNSTQFTTTHDMDAVFGGDDNWVTTRNVEFEVTLSSTDPTSAPVFAQIDVFHSVAEGYSISSNLSPDSPPLLSLTISITRSLILTTTALASLTYALSLLSAFAAWKTTWDVVVEGKALHGAERIGFPLTIAGTIVALRTIFPVIPKLGGAVDSWLYFPSLYISLGASLITATMTYKPFGTRCRKGALYVASRFSQQRRQASDSSERTVAKEKGEEVV